MKMQQKYDPLIYASVLTLAFGAWLAFRLLYPDVMGGIDVYHFKDAGCNMGMGHGFVSSSYVGTESFERLIWLSQGPLYPYLFGLFASAFGCTANANNIFELLIACTLTTQAIFLLTKFKFSASGLFILMGFAIFAPTGGYEWEPDRPDHLALIFILASVICNTICQNPTLRHRSSFLFAGLALITSPYYGFVGAILAILYLSQDQEQHTQITTKIITTNLISFFTPIIFVIAIYLIADPSSFSRFLKHARIITSTDIGFFEKLRHGISSAGLVSYINFIRFLLVTIFLIYALIDKDKFCGSIKNKRIAWTLLALAAITLTAFPKQGNYFSAISYISIIIWIHASEQESSPVKNFEFMRLTLGAMLFFALLPGIVTSAINPIRMRDSYFAQKKQINSLTNIQKNAKDNSITTVPASHYFLYKEKFDYIFNPDYINKKHNLQSITAIVLCRTGRKSEIYQDSIPGWYVFSSPPNPPLNGGLIGIFEMNSYWDWGCFMFKKKNEITHTLPDIGEK